MRFGACPSAIAGTLMAACGLASSAAGAPRVLRDADVSIKVTSPTTCEVSMALTVEGAPEIDHRVWAFDGARIELIETPGAQRASDVHTIGRTESLVLRPAAPAYAIRYRVHQPDARAGRCPLWVPAIPADGRSPAIGIRVQLPPRAAPGRSMPALDWTGSSGTARLRHLPAFVHVPYSIDGHAGWSIEQVMDAATVAIFGALTLVWVWRKR